MNQPSIIAAMLLVCSSLLVALADSAVGVRAEPDSKTVTITNFQFSPKRVTVKAGSDVTWEVKEGVHTVTADKGLFESQNLSAGQKFSFKFTKPGAYRYYCSFHGGKGGHEMAGTVMVVR
jgi:plastocyanin